MKINLKSIVMVAAAVLMAVACKKEEKPGTGTGAGNLVIESITLSSETVTPPAVLTFDAVVTDEAISLSTMEISAVLNGEVLCSKSVRTSGNRAEIKDETIDIPFVANMEEGAQIGLTFEAINVEGRSVKQNKVITVNRPAMPEVLYMTIGGAQYEMTMKDGTPDVYVTAEGSFESEVTAYVSTAADMETADMIWGISETVNVAGLIEFGADPATISFPATVVDAFTFNTLTFEFGAEGETLNLAVNGVELVPAYGLLTASVELTKGAEVTVTGLENLETSYNRDLFTFADGKLTFMGETGTWEVYYAPKYDYFWVMRMTDEMPDACWMIGHGFASSPRWHEDFSKGGWTYDVPTRLGYGLKTDDNKYQFHVYINADHEWLSAEFGFYANLAEEENKAYNPSIQNITGDIRGLSVVSGNDGGHIVSGLGFQEGYYRIVVDASSSTAEFTRLSDWLDTSSPYYIGGVNLEKDQDYYSGVVSFTQGAEVQFTGFEDITGSYNRDFFSYENGKLTFLRNSGSWNVCYYPQYNYMWVFNNELTIPDCLYVLGNGKLSTPVWYNEVGAPEDYFYARNAPYYCVMPSIGDGKYQATMYLSDDNDWKDVRLEFYSDTAWGKDAGIRLGADALTGPDAGMFTVVDPGEEKNNLHYVSSSFKAGYFRFVMTVSDGGPTLEITRIAD